MNSKINYLSFLTILFIITLCSHLSHSSGVFEIKLKFINDRNIDQDGLCCDGSQPLDLLSKCKIKCDTYIRVCLRHYEPVISQDGRCTFGEAIVKHDHVYDTARIPFNFTWPLNGEFALILEAYFHDTKSEDLYGPVRKTIMRIEKQHSVTISTQWQRDVSSEKHMSMEYDYRVICSSDSYGKGCAQTCIPRNDTFGHWYCTDQGKKCHQGWTGPFCEVPICAPGCKGTCKKPGGCECRNGYEGKLCDQCIRRIGCVHGKCAKPYECACEPGWGGLYCDQDMNYCKNHHPCRNGTCTNVGKGSYECKCHLGFTGVNCDVRIPNCSKSPCINGATCKNVSLSSNNNPANSKGYSCECLPRTFGEHCENIGDPPIKDTCSVEPCQNGGTCTNIRSGFICSCLAGYGGAKCQIKKTSCDQNPCSNDAECVPIAPNVFRPANPSYQCRCKPGFTGEHCEIIINDCQANSCRNGGTCIDGPESFMCICPRGISGQFCDIAVIPTPPHSLNDPFYPEQLSFSRLVLISVASIIIPMVAVMAAAIVFAFQKRRVRSQERQWFENEEAIRQNEENSAKKRLSNGTYVIVNNLDRDKSVSSSPSVNDVDCGVGPNNYEIIKNSQTHLYQHIDGGVGGGGGGGGGSLVGPVLPGRLTVGLTVGLPPPSSDLRKSTSSLFRTKKIISRIDENNLNSHTNNFRNSVHNINTANYNNNLTVRTVNISSLLNAATIKDQPNRI